MGSSPDNRRRASAERMHATTLQDATRDATRTLEDLRTDALLRIQHARRAREANPFDTASQTIEYADEDTVESSPSDAQYRSLSSQHQPHTAHVEIAQPNQPLWKAGTLIAHRYRLLEPLGAGAWGTIWKARQEGIERFVAVKILKEREPQSMTNARSRFEREAKLASRIRHPSAVRVLDFGYRNNQPYLVMEWLQGLTLQSFLRECGPLPPELVVDIGIGICGALHAAHEEGVIHRDLKPSNIMLVETSSGLTPVVVDFGLARTFAPDEPTVTRDDMIVGTPAYMCPESIRGRPLTPTSDVYSLGVTFLTALLGENPFRGESGSVTMTNHLLERPVDRDTLELIGCSPALASALLAMIALEPEERPNARMLEFHFQQLLDEFIQGEIPDTHPAADALNWSDEYDAWSLETSEFADITSPSSMGPQLFSEPPAAPPVRENTAAAALTKWAPSDAVRVRTTAAPDASPLDSNPDAQLHIPRAQDRSPMAWQNQPTRYWSTVAFPLLLVAALGVVLIQQRSLHDATPSTTDTAPLVNEASAQGFIADVQGASQEAMAVQMSATRPAPAFEDTTSATATASSLSNTFSDSDVEIQRVHADTPSAPDSHQKDASTGSVVTIDDTTAQENANAVHHAVEDDLNNRSTSTANDDPVADDSAGPLEANDRPRKSSTKSTAAATPTSRAGTSSRRASSKRTSAAAAEPATLVLTLSPPGEVYVGDKAYGMRSSLMLNEIKSGRHTIRVQRGEQHEERRVRLKPGERHVESF